MSSEFTVEVSSFRKISTIENVWNANDYKAILGMFDMDEDDLDGMNEDELKEMCMMSLNDCDADESARHVLSYIFKDEEDITAGKIDQMSHQMVDTDMWEEYADPAYHLALFNAYGLLRKAYNGTFSVPTGVKFTIKINAKSADSFDIFDESLHAVIVRLLANGLSEGEILNRLFEDKIKGKSFPSAEHILWILNEVSKTDTEREYEIISSELWFGELAKVASFEADAHADVEVNEDEDD